MISLVGRIIDRNTRYSHDASYDPECTQNNVNDKTSCVSCKEKKGGYSKKTAHERFEEKFWIFSGLFTIATAGAALYAALFAGWAYSEARRQAIAAEGQLAEAKKQTVQAQRQADVAERGSRAWVYVEFASRGAIRAQTGRSGTPGTISLAVDAEFKIVNHGTVPASIDSISSEVIIQQKLTHTDFHPEAIQFPYMSGDAFSHQCEIRTINAGGECEEKPRYQLTSVIPILAEPPGDFYVRYIHVVVKYHDPFGEGYETSVYRDVYGIGVAGAKELQKHNYNK